MSKFILLSDPHLMNRTPECRMDDFRETQIRKAKWLSVLKEKHDATILCSGDANDKSTEPNMYSILELWDHMPQIYCVPGNHDLKNKLYDNFVKGTYNRLVKEGKILHLQEPTEVNGVLIHPFGWNVPVYSPEPNGRINLCLIHKGLMMDTKDKFGGGLTGKNFLHKYKFDIVVSGDNHKHFINEEDGRYLFNVGSFMRIKSDQVHHKPCVILWDSTSNTYEKIYVPIEDVVSREKREFEVGKNKYMMSMIENAKGKGEVSTSFQETMGSIMQEESENIKNIIRGAME